MKPLIEAIVKSLVDKPDDVQIKEVIGEHAHVLELRVDGTLHKTVSHFSHPHNYTAWLTETASHDRSCAALATPSGLHSAIFAAICSRLSALPSRCEVCSVLNAWLFPCARFTRSRIADKVAKAAHNTSARCWE